jgi:hypothetical protein
MCRRLRLTGVFHPPSSPYAHWLKQPALGGKVDHNRLQLHRMGQKSATGSSGAMYWLNGALPFGENDRLLHRVTDEGA